MLALEMMPLWLPHVRREPDPHQAEVFLIARLTNDR
jgi:hypothetical protein